ncbi:hypothetical protein BDP27DRAFT_1500771 [Rhodocollybia butyracea]|uniref:Uncharacterized protein n=1 Tax=Rhodocollybia butyracea TaxID=206335 RepID=A0A9P5P9V5_9AGAR|nr:hypothetical protein BDP27DRAFT_1500771 [Rhodocollybia butyracea]
MGFVTAASNLRSASYRIEEKTRWEVPKWLETLSQQLLPRAPSYLWSQAPPLFQKSQDKLRSVHLQFNPAIPLSTITLSTLFKAGSGGCGIYRNVYTKILCFDWEITMEFERNFVNHGDEALRRGTGQRSQWQLGLLPSGPTFILPNPLPKPSKKECHLHQSSPIYPPVSLKMSALDTDDSDIVVLDLHKAYMVPWNLALYMDTTINTEGIGIVTEEDSICTTALKTTIIIIYRMILLKPIRAPQDPPFMEIMIEDTKVVVLVSRIDRWKPCCPPGEEWTIETPFPAPPSRLNIHQLDRMCIKEIKSCERGRGSPASLIFIGMGCKSVDLGIVPSYSGEFHLVSTWPHSGWLQKDKSSWKGRPISPSNPMLYLQWSVLSAPSTAVALAPVSFASAPTAVSVAPQPSSGFNNPNLNPTPTPATDPYPDPDIGLGLSRLHIAELADHEMT